MLQELIQAAIYAPSWKNSQTSRYYVVQTKEIREAFQKNCLPDFNAHSSQNAKALIVSTYVKNRSGFERDGKATNELGNGWGSYDLGLHDENLLLKAKEMGLATLVMGIRDAGKIRDMLQVPEEEEVVAVIAVGYAKEEPVMPKRKQVEDIVHFF